MICVTSRGGDYSSGPLQPYDFVENYLRTIFGFCGITDIRFFNLQPMDVSMETRNASYKTVLSEARAYVEGSNWEAEVGAPWIEVPKALEPGLLLESVPLR